MNESTTRTLIESSKKEEQMSAFMCEGSSVVPETVDQVIASALTPGLMFLHEIIRKVKGVKPGDDFQNETFVMRPWSEPKDDDEKDLPNFECDGLKVWWYKRIGRGMETDRNISVKEVHEIITRCLYSLLPDNAGVARTS